MISLYKRGHVWWVKGLIGSRYLRQSLKTADRQVAWQRAQRLEREEGRKPVFWKDFEKEFFVWIESSIRSTTREKYTFVMSRFGRFLQEHGVDELRSITPSLIVSYKSDRQQDLHPTRNIRVGAPGLRSDLRILRRVFSYALRCGYIGDNPVIEPRLNALDANTEPFGKADVQTMLAHPMLREKPDLRTVILFFLYTGLRISDVIDCPISGVDPVAGTLSIRTRKTQTELNIPLHADLAEALHTHLGRITPLQRDCGLLFATKKGKPDLSLDAKLRRFWKACGIAGGHAHRFRDTFAVRMLEQGATLYDVAKLLGNSVAVCERHYTPYVRELRERNKRFVDSLSFE